MTSARLLGSLAIILSLSVPAVSGLQASAQAAGRHSLPPSPANPANPIDDATLREQVRAAAQRRTEGAADTMIDLEVLPASSAAPAAETAIRQLITAAGGRVTGSVPGYLVQASVPASKIESLALSDGVEYVRAPVGVFAPEEPASVTAPARTEAWTDSWNRMNVQPWRDAGVDGTGVKVGLIGGFDSTTWAQVMAQGKLTTPSGTYCMLNGAVCPYWSLAWFNDVTTSAEALYRVAPGASVYLGQAYTASDLSALVQWFIDQGVKVLGIPELRFMDGPGNGTGATNAVIDYAVSKGVLVVGSTPAQYTGHQYWRGTWSDTNNNRWLEFAPGDETMDITGCYPVINGLRWNDWGTPSTRTNYDLFVFDGAEQVYPAANATKGPDQKTGAPPIEGGRWTLCRMTTMEIKVKLATNSTSASTAGDVLELALSRDKFIERGQVANAIVGPVSDSTNPGVLVVGALDVLDWPAAHGPTNGGAVKPDLVAEPCWPTVVAGTDCIPSFSDASAIVTGMAALLLDAGVTSSALSTADFLRTYASPDHAPRPNNLEGYGFARLPDPPTGGLDNSPAKYVALTPARVFDTRTAGLCFAYCGPRAPRSILDIDVTGTGGVPASGVSAVAVNVTMRDTAAAGWVQAVPTLLGPLGGTSTQNVEGPGMTRPNFAIVPVGADGSITLYDVAGGQVFVDVLGYFTPAGGDVAAGRFQPVVPYRALQTTTGSKPAAGSTTVVSSFGATVDAAPAAAVVLNVTATRVDTAGFVTVYPSTAGLPVASTLNVVPGATIANMLIVPLGADGTVSLYTSSQTDLIVDVMGYITDETAPVSGAGLFVPLAPSRPLDTRNPSNPLQAGVDRNLVVATGSPVPTNAIAVSLNATVTGMTQSGWAKISAAGAAPAVFSNVNYGATGVIAAAVLAGVGTGGAVTIYSSKATHFIVDVNGYFTGEPPTM